MVCPFTFSADDSVIVLKSQNGEDVSLVQYMFNLEENTYYRISFDARSSAPEDAELTVDFYTAPSYDDPDRDKTYISDDIKDVFRNYVLVFNSGINSPEVTYLRLFTYSQAPVEIKNIRLEKLGSVFPYYWGPEKAGTSMHPLYEKRHETANGICIYENMNFLPRSRFVRHIRAVDDFFEANQILSNEYDFNSATTALVEGYSNVTSLDYGEVLSSDYSRNDSVELSVRTGKNSFLVLSDTWYAGWKAFVDGTETKIYKANGVVRGIFIEGDGLHTVEFVFRPKSFYIGLSISVFTFLIIIFAVILMQASDKFRSR